MMLSRNAAFVVVISSIGLCALVFSYYAHQMKNLTSETNTNMLGALGQLFAARDTKKKVLSRTAAPVKVPAKPPVPCVAPEYDFVNADQLDPKLLKYIRKEMLVPPSPFNYSLKNPSAIHYSQYGQSKYADDNYLHGMRGGFFVEVGAWDGEFLSNSLFFEKHLGWQGLLIEANSSRFEQLSSKRRKAYLVNAALSLSTQAGYINYGAEAISLGKGTKVKAFPFISLLLALDIKVVDFLSLDIESFEVKVLKTIPWDKIKFRLMCIEYKVIPEGGAYLTKFLKEKGYNFLSATKIDYWYGHPDYFPIKAKGKA